jgi:hypothetical protein
MTSTEKQFGFTLKGPGNFDGTKNKWEGWTFKFKNYASTFDFRYRDALTEVEQLSRTATVDTAWIDKFDLNNPNNNPHSKDLKQLDKDLYSVLSELLQGPAQTHVTAERTSGSGLAVWKRLTARYSTASPLKAMKLMNEVCDFNFKLQTRSLHGGLGQVGH